VLLHAILEAHLIPYHAIADDINKMVTMADICGPAVLVDSSLVFMHYLASIRNSMIPSASQKTSSYVIRWVFTTWKPGRFSPFIPMLRKTRCIANGLHADIFSGIGFRCICGIQHDAD
jgi:hypothetical protein